MVLNSTQRRVDTLIYIRALLEQLRAMAESEQFEMLAFLIDMAQLEAREGLDRLLLLQRNE
jgi:hypothetical protein